MSVNPSQLAAMCAAAMPDERLTERELTRLCFGDGDEVLGDADAAAVLTVKQFGKRLGEHVAAWLVLAVVRPEVQGKGNGKRIVREVVERARARGARSLHLANAVPRYIWPGVELTNTRAGMLFESLGFERDLVGMNMTIPSSFRRDPPPGVVVEREQTGGAVEFAHRSFPHWVEELEVAIANGTAFAARDAHGATIGFGCHSCNRATWIGPMATDPDAQHGGIGSAILAAICADLDERGHAMGEIAWVSNLRFYGKCGATVSRIFQGGRLDLSGPRL